MPGVFSLGSHVFVHLLIGQSHTSRSNLERDIKANQKNKYIEGRVVTGLYSCKVAQCDQFCHNGPCLEKMFLVKIELLIKLCKT